MSLVHFSVARRSGHAGAWPLLLGQRAEGESLQHWLRRSLRLAIGSGKLAPGSALPASRSLALQLQVSRGTVTAVYDQLLAEGYVVARRGSGTVVNPKLPDAWLVAGRRSAEGGGVRRASFEPRTTLARMVDKRGARFPAPPSTGEYFPFTPHMCDFRSFPIEVWRRLYSRNLRTSHVGLLADAPAQGLQVLRKAIAENLSLARGVSVDPARVVVVSSVHQALDIAARLVLQPGDVAWMEDPGYPAARRVLEAAGADIADVPIDAHGIDVEQGVLCGVGARFAYVTPSRQAPLGIALAPQRRQRLLAWASASSAYLFEDDYDSEFRFNARPVPALKAEDFADRVFLAGSFGKLMFPGLRLSFVVPPSALLTPFVAALSIVARPPNTVLQAVLAEFINSGEFDRHVRRMRRLYAARAEALAHAANRHWEGCLRLPAMQAGLDVTAALVGGMDDVDAARRLRAAGLGPWALRAYTTKRLMPSALVIGFASLDEGTIEAAARDVARILR